MRKYITEQQNAIQGISEPLTEIRLTVFGEPVAKGRPRFSGHAYTPEKTRKHEEKIALMYKWKYGNRKFEKDVPVRVVLDFFFKIPKGDKKAIKEAKITGKIRPTKRPDTDNVEKTVMDAVLKLAYEDDSQVVELIGRKFYSMEPRTEIYIARVDCEE